MVVAEVATTLTAKAALTTANPSLHITSIRVNRIQGILLLHPTAAHIRHRVATLRRSPSGIQIMAIRPRNPRTLLHRFRPPTTIPTTPTSPILLLSTLSSQLMGHPSSTVSLIKPNRRRRNGIVKGIPRRRRMAIVAHEGATMTMGVPRWVFLYKEGMSMSSHRLR